MKGCPFIIFSDHQPLKYLFDENRSVPAMASSRIQRWALTFHRHSSSKLVNADTLSRLPLAETVAHVPIPGGIHLLFDVYLYPLLLQLTSKSGLTKTLFVAGTQICPQWLEQLSLRFRVAAFLQL